jgi:hypothetical protein
VPWFIGIAMLVPAGTQAADLEWLTGRWCGGEGGEKIVEQWLPPVAGETIGMSRSVRDGRVQSFEFLRIARRDGVATYLAQPGGRPATAFPRSASGADWIRFANPAHDFPQQIEYRRDGAGLVAEISGPGKDGKRRAITYRYARCDD